METPLSRLEFARRTRTRYPVRDAVVDGELRLSYKEFFDRCAGRGSAEKFSQTYHSRDGSAHDQLYQRHYFKAEGSDDHPSERLLQRNWDASSSSDDTDGSLSLDLADVSCQRLDLCVDGDGRGRGSHLPAKG